MKFMFISILHRYEQIKAEINAGNEIREFVSGHTFPKKGTPRSPIKGMEAARKGRRRAAS
jgi:hypothetical protein